MDDVKKNPGVASDTPHTRLWRQVNALNDALFTIDGQYSESESARVYIVAQIEALKWAAKLYEV